MTTPKNQSKAPRVFCEFVADATSSKSAENGFWEDLRRQTRFKTVKAMFARWRQLAGIEK